MDDARDFRIGRRGLLLAAAFMTGVAAAPGPGEGKSVGKLAWDFSFPSIDGGTLDLARFRGRVLLVVNTASFCGYTYQYRALEALQRELSPRGLTVVGVPSQDFHQESGSNAEVKQFCEATFDVRFPMAGISHVTGQDAAPFYRWVKEARGWAPDWNFCKVLIGRDGTIIGTYRSADEPRGARLAAAIGAALAQPAV